MTEGTSYGQRSEVSDMALIRPFNITHYDTSLNGVLNKLITPPYDVISSEEQELFYMSHPLNIIRLVLGKEYSSDSETDNRYTRAAETLRQWLRQGVLICDKKPGVAVYQMSFQLPDGGIQTIDGIVALVKVDDYGRGKVLPHEKTYKGPKEDQLKLLRACRSNFTPIHGLFEDDSNVISTGYADLLETYPLQETEDAQGSMHRIWIIHDELLISRMTDFMKDKSIFIADGHHRYETARSYKEELECSKSRTADDSREFVMMYLTAMNHPGLTILPAHRMIRGLDPFDLTEILEKLSQSFEIENVCYWNGNKGESVRVMLERLEAGATTGGQFGFVVHGDECLRLLRLKDFSILDHLIGQSIPKSVRTLDVTILGELVLSRALGIDKMSGESYVEYTPLAQDALKRVFEGQVQASFILNPTRVDQMQAAAELGHKLPHKSTYFYPKLSSGLILNVFDGLQ